MPLLRDVVKVTLPKGSEAEAARLADTALPEGQRPTWRQRSTRAQAEALRVVHQAPPPSYVGGPREGEAGVVVDGEGDLVHANGVRAAWVAERRSMYGRAIYRSGDNIVLRGSGAPKETALDRMTDEQLERELGRQEEALRRMAEALERRRRYSG